MKRNYFFVLAVILIFTVSFCQNSSKKGTGKDSDSNSVMKEGEKTITEGVKRYQIKSGIVELKTTVMNMTSTLTRYFDNYGEIEATETKAKIMGMETHKISIMKDGYMYDIDMIAKTGTKIKISELKNMNINFNDLEKLTKDVEINKLGTEEFLGKTCDKFSVVYKNMQMKGTYLVWKGIDVKSEIEAMGMKTKTEATKIEEKAVPAEKFEIPADVKITETNLRDVQKEIQKGQNEGE